MEAFLEVEQVVETGVGEHAADHGVWSGRPAVMDRRLGVLRNATSRLWNWGSGSGSPHRKQPHDTQRSRYELHDLPGGPASNSLPQAAASKTGHNDQLNIRIRIILIRIGSIRCPGSNKDSG